MYIDLCENFIQEEILPIAFSDENFIKLIFVLCKECIEDMVTLTALAKI